jgi:hypothetical protein
VADSTAKKVKGLYNATVAKSSPADSLAKVREEYPSIAPKKRAPRVLTTKRQKNAAKKAPAKKAAPAPTPVPTNGKYTLKAEGQKDGLYARKDAAVSAGKRSGTTWRVLSPAGKVVAVSDDA